MSTYSKIEWTEITWNPVTGCTKISEGCNHCYAERMSKRLNAMGVVRYSNAFIPTIHEDLINLPFHWKQPKMIFVNSMSDLFHDSVPLEFIQSVFRTMKNCPQHVFQVLTKRSKRLVEIQDKLEWSDNIWMGVSVENSKVIDRIDDLRRIPANVRFLSCEPLLGPIPNMNLSGIHWVIVGGESGPFSRPMKKEWVELIYSQCTNNSVPFFFKQWGGTRKHLNGRTFHEKTFDEMPLRVA